MDYRHKGNDKITKVKVVQLEEVRDFMSEDDDSPTPSQNTSPPHLMIQSVSLNPHKALQALGGIHKAHEDPSQSVLGLEAMRNIRGAVGRKSAAPINRKTTRMSPADPPLQAPPPQVIRERTASRSGDRDIIARKCRISNSFIELERLLEITNKKSRAEVLEYSVRHIKSLQKSINEAGERNSDLHDMVESISVTNRGEPRPSNASAENSFLGSLLSRCNKSDVREFRGEFAKIASFTSVDTLLMSFVGLAANIAPAEQGISSVEVSLHGISKWLVRLLAIILLGAFLVRHLRSERVFSVRKVLVSLLSLGGGPSPGEMPPSTAFRQQQLSEQRLVPSARSRSSSSSSVPRAHIVAPTMRKIYSAEDLEASAIPQAVITARSRAISNPVAPLSRPPPRRPITLNHHHHNLRSRAVH